MNYVLSYYQYLLQQLKRYMPQSLFGRALLILVLPTILMQIVVVTIFYDRHWDSIQRHLSSSLAGEVAVVVQRAQTVHGVDRDMALDDYARLMNMDITLTNEPVNRNDDQYDRFDHYANELATRVAVPFVVYESGGGENVRTHVDLGEQSLRIDVGIKRLESSTTYIFITWIISSALLLTIIAIAFLRNQIRPIRRLAYVAEQFGMGHDISNFRPHGAEEVRTAGYAFIVMRARLLRQISTRTAMLSGISHDLRTPLTRLKLQLAMLPESDDTQAMAGDIDEMEVMLEEYLEFARGNDNRANVEPVDIAEWLHGVVQSYLSLGASITYSLPESMTLSMRPRQLKRAVENIISNALKYGGHAHVSLEFQERWVVIAVDDEGQGIPDDMMEEVFRPFTRLEESRNSDTGGVGLGLAITRDIVQAHGGRIHMHNRVNDHGHINGLQVAILLPLPKNR